MTYDNGKQKTVFAPGRRKDRYVTVPGSHLVVCDVSFASAGID